jgi:hypothetical protein
VVFGGGRPYHVLCDGAQLPVQMSSLFLGIPFSIATPNHNSIASLKHGHHSKSNAVMHAVLHRCRELRIRCNLFRSLVHVFYSASYSCTGFVLCNVCRVTCIMANTACLTPDGAMLCALCLAGPVCKIHPSLVAPVLSYGCEVWGAYALASIGTQTCAWGAGNALLGESASVQKAFLRDSLRVSQSTSGADDE